MIFPESPRVVYEQNPLVEVITQLRFPPILKIESELPAKFQEILRSEYPVYRPREQAVIDGLPEALRPLVNKMLGGSSPAAQATGHEFVSDDEVNRVVLSRNFIALTTNRYRRWEDFRPRIERAVSALVATYHPAPFTRVGLRYRNVIARERFGLTGTPWRELLAPHIAGELAAKNLADHTVAEAKRAIRIQSSALKVNLQHELQGIDDENEDRYIVDADLFTEERMDDTAALSFLDSAHTEAGRLWRWCISDQLHERLGPRPA